MTKELDTKPGYIKTSLGWIPDDWKLCNLKDIANIDADNLNSQTPDSYIFKYVSLSDVVAGNLNPNLKEYSIGDSPSRARRIVNYGDILMATVRPNLKAFLLIDFKLDNLIASTGFAVISTKKKAVNKYIYQYLFSHFAEKQFYSLTVGSSYPALNGTDVKSFKVALPPLPEQKRIAEILSCWDKAIYKLEQLIAKKEELKKGLMQQLLTGKIRLHDTNGQQFKDEWKEVRLGEVYKIVGGGTPDTNEKTYWNGDIQWFTPTEIQTKYLEKSERTITNLGLENSSAKLLPKGTLLFTSRATIGEIGICLTLCTTNQGFQSFIPNNKNSTEFLYYWIILNKNIFIKQASGSTFLEISGKEIGKITLENPSLAEQLAIVEILKKADNEIEILTQSLSALQIQKKGLMQQLLTGKTRVKL